MQAAFLVQINVFLPAFSRSRIFSQKRLLRNDSHTKKFVNCKKKKKYKTKTKYKKYIPKRLSSPIREKKEKEQQTSLKKNNT